MSIKNTIFLLNWIWVGFKLVNGNQKMKKEEQGRSLFGISLSDKPRWQQFLICSSGFFFGYLVNGICEVYMIFSLFGFSWIHFDFVYVIFLVYNFFNQIMLQYRQDVNDGIFVFFVSLCVEWVRNFVLFDFAKFLNHYFVNYASNFHFFFLILIVFVSYIWSFFLLI